MTLKLIKSKINYKTMKLRGYLLQKENRQYATGFTGSAGVVLLSADQAVFITDFRYVDQAKSQIKDAEIIMHKGNLEKEIAHQVSKLNIQKLGIEENNMTLQQYKNLQKYVQAEMIQVCEIIENIRIIKDTPEIETMKIAANIADEAFHHILTFLKPGISENAVRDELEFFMRKRCYIFIISNYCSFWCSFFSSTWSCIK